MKRSLAATFALVGAVVMSGHAQAWQPIYLQYDGYVKNTDGTYTLSFGYYNLNHSDVTIQAGSDNSFTPGPADRNQPIMFLEGRHRFTCSMVVGPDFDGKLQWTVKFAGKTSTTTQKAMDPLYQLELNSEKRAIAGLDARTAQRGICTNRAPAVSVINPFADVNAGAAGLSATVFNTRIGQELNLLGTVEDDSLPRGSKVTQAWKKISGPGDVTFSSPATPRTGVTFTAPGEYELELAATDGTLNGNVRVKVHVAAAAASAPGGGEGSGTPSAGPEGVAPGIAPPAAYRMTMKDINAANTTLRGHEIRSSILKL